MSGMARLECLLAVSLSRPLLLQMDPTNPDVVGTEYDIAYDAKFRRVYRHEHMPNPPNPNRYANSDR